MFVEFKIALGGNTIYIEPDAISYVRPLRDNATLVGIKGMPQELQLEENIVDVVKRLEET